MLSELSEVMDIVDDPNAPVSQYHDAIISANCLGKPTMRSREDSYRHLRSLYSFSQDEPIFVALRYFWERDMPGRRLLALLAAYSRDRILKQSSNFILDLTAGEGIDRRICNCYSSTNSCITETDEKPDGSASCYRCSWSSSSQ